LQHVARELRSELAWSNISDSQEYEVWISFVPQDIPKDMCIVEHSIPL